MMHPLLKTLPFGFVSLALMTLTPPLSASGPVKIDAGIHWRFDVKLGSGPHIPKAPWYSYFPYDPNLQQPGPPNPYPVWPQPFPAASSPTPSGGPDLPAAPGATGTHSVGYRGVPSYWYGR
jgi:hypothetical protein